MPALPEVLAGIELERHQAAPGNLGKFASHFTTTSGAQPPRIGRFVARPRAAWHEPRRKPHPDSLQRLTMSWMCSGLKCSELIWFFDQEYWDFIPQASGYDQGWNWWVSQQLRGACSKQRSISSPFPCHPLEAVILQRPALRACAQAL